MSEEGGGGVGEVFEKELKLSFRAGRERERERESKNRAAG